MIGTILPSEADLCRDEVFAARQIDKHERALREEFPAAVRRIVDCEIRYYLTPAKYTPITLTSVRRWFDVRAEGDFATTAPKKGGSR